VVDFLIIIIIIIIIITSNSLINYILLQHLIFSFNDAVSGSEREDSEWQIYTDSSNTQLGLAVMRFYTASFKSFVKLKRTPHTIVGD
jgi:hypothetical protein